MQHAVELAGRAWGDTHPNPLVGAVIVKDGAVIGEGWHARAGEPHAEIVALRQAGGQARGATLYVTLEPCSTHGRTPPCVDAIIAAGIVRVVVGAVDPNPAHAGRGLDMLRANGVEVTGGVLDAECRRLNPIFNHWITRNTPLFAGKVATTLCGRVATRSGHSQWITGEAARSHVHRLRRYFPAIAVGRGTILADNPKLTSRLPGIDEWSPLRFVFDRSLRTVCHPLPNVYSDTFRSRTIVFAGENAPASQAAELERNGVEIVRLPESPDEAAFDALRAFCVQRGVHGVLFEGGQRLLSTVLGSGHMDYLYAYRAPILLADEAAVAGFTGSAPDFLQQGWRLRDVGHATFGDDELMHGWLTASE